MEIKTRDELNKVISENDVVVARVHAEWCGPCKVLGKTFAEIERENIDSGKFVGIDSEEADEEFLTELGIRNIPTIIYYKNGEQVDRTVGLVSKQALLDKISEIKGE